MMVVHEALKNSRTPEVRADDEDSLISLLIHDIFGGEILKTHKKRGWHFYNRINGERIDFTSSEFGKFSVDNRFEDLPSTPDETYNYFEQEDYASFFMRFIWAFEEAVGLEKSQPAYTAWKFFTSAKTIFLQILRYAGPCDRQSREF